MNTAPAQTRLITGEELLAMGDIGPCELIDGEIIPMSPTGGVHGWIEHTLDRTLGVFVDERDLGWVMVGEVGIYTRRNPDQVCGADVAFGSHERLPDGPPSGFPDVAPNLVVEVISPTDCWQDIREKIEEYFAIGVDRVWVVVPRTRSVLVYWPGGRVDRFVDVEGNQEIRVVEGAERMSRVGQYGEGSMRV